MFFIRDEIAVVGKRVPTDLIRQDDAVCLARSHTLSNTPYQNVCS